MPDPNWPDFQMPWIPRPQASNVYAWARILASYGYNVDEIRERLRATYNVPGAAQARVRESDITNAARQAFRQNAGLQALFALGDMTAKPPRNRALLNPAISESYRYHVLFEAGPDQEGNPVYRTVIINSKKILSFAQIREAAGQLYAEIADYYGKFRDAPIFGNTPWILQLHERRTR
jgi:hypothetical protein